MALPLALVFVAAVSHALAQAPRAQTLAVPPPLPLTQLDERARFAELDNRTFSLTFAQPVALHDVLLLLVRGTSLSIVPDPSANGMFIGDLKNVTLRQALGLILQPFGFDFSAEGGVIRVFKRELDTRLYDVSFLALDRVGATSVGTDSNGSTARVLTSAKSDVFADITRGIPTILSDKGTFNVDRKAGLVQVTDTRERLDRVGTYLDAVQVRVQRQVQIDVRVLEIELNDEKATTLDWTALRQTRDFERVMAALNAQGLVHLVANPRLSVLNNEPGLVKTDAMTLSVTPQISPDSVITLGLTPLLSGPQTLEADMVARVADGDTIVIAGPGHDRETKERKNVTKRHVEIAVLLTPRIVPLP